MKKELIEQILEKLEDELHIEKNSDFIGELFDDRADTIHSEITKHKEYKKYIDQINEIDEEIKEKSNNYWDIIKVIEKSRNITYKNSDLCEKLMYKYGLYDGMKLILEGTRNINLSEFLKENSNEV